MQINKEYKDNTNFYTFTNRGTEYTIIIKDNDTSVEVWTKTKKWGVNVKFYPNIIEFANANKTFVNFIIKLVEAK